MDKEEGIVGKNCRRDDFFVHNSTTFYGDLNSDCDLSLMKKEVYGLATDFFIILGPLS